MDSKGWRLCLFKLSFTFSLKRTGNTVRFVYIVQKYLSFCLQFDD